MSAEGWTPIRTLRWTRDVDPVTVPEYRGGHGTGRQFQAGTVDVEVFDRGGPHPHQSVTVALRGIRVRRDGTMGVQSMANYYDADRLDTYPAEVLPDVVRAAAAPVAAEALALAQVSDMAAVLDAADDVLELAVPSVTGTGAEVYELPMDPIDRLAAVLGRRAGSTT